MWNAFWDGLAGWAGDSKWRHMLIQGTVGLAILFGAQWIFEPWVPDLIHLGVCQVIGPC